MLTKSEQERFAEDACNDIWAVEAEKIAMQRDQLKAERDLLVSRLCAIAFEAGLYGARARQAWDETVGDFVYLWPVVLAPEEVK